MAADASDAALAASQSIVAATQGAAAEGLPDRIAAFLRKQRDAPAIRSITIDNARRSAGASSGTVLFDVKTDAGATKRFVFRYDLGGAFFSQYELAPQFTIMQGLRARGLPAPEALWLDAAGEVNGQPGLFMRRIAGAAPSTSPFTEGTFMDVGPAQRHAMLLEAARTIACFNATPPTGLADDYFARRGGTGHYLDREIAWNLTELRRVIPPREPGAKADFYRDIRNTLEAVGRWLSANAPRDRPAELAHGDANISNFMYDANGAVAALLDWELAHPGIGESDLAYQIAGIAHFALLAPPVTGIPSPEEMIAAYREARGKLDDWAFAQVLGEWRLALFASMGMSRLPPELAAVERTYWHASRGRLHSLVPELRA